MQQQTVNGAVTTFLSLLSKADSVDVDSQLLSNWDVSEPKGDDTNEVVRFSWVDDEGLVFSVVLTEGGIAKGKWVGCSFICDDSDGDEVKMSLHKHIALTAATSSRGDVVGKTVRSAYMQSTCKRKGWSNQEAALKVIEFLATPGVSLFDFMEAQPSVTTH